MYPTKGQQGFQPTLFCPKGHNKDFVGRNASGNCSPCAKAKTQLWKAKNPEKRRIQSQRQNWKVAHILNSEGKAFTALDFDRAYQIQQGKCLICGIHQSRLKDALCVDHSHTTKRFRGLLCKPCNLLLGNANDSLEILQAGIKYLDGELI